MTADKRHSLVRPVIFRVLFALVITSSIAGLAGLAKAEEWRHGMSLFGELKYEAGFAHYDYVNPEAPKGGVFRQSATGTFDTLNPFNIKGNAAAGAQLIYDTLMDSAADEPSSEYGLLAEAVRYPGDYSSVTFRLRPEARWHDGKPVTPEDVIFSLGALKAAHPFYNAYYRNVVEAIKSGERDVTFRFDQSGNRELPQITGQLPILPKHYWEGEDAGGKPRDFNATTLEPPLGSGPYKIGAMSPGRSISLARVKDYWGKDLPVNTGRHNFDELRFEYFRDSTVLLEAFKADAFDMRAENIAKQWATGYDFPARQRGDVVLESFGSKNAKPMQGFIFNTRRAKFSDPRVRQAFNYAFDFEWMNANIFFGQYTRTSSYFENSELKATGLPESEELALLEPLRDQLPPEVFTTPFENPVWGGKRDARKNLIAARDLLKDAGWAITRKGGKAALTNADGDTLSVEVLVVQPEMERLIGPYLKNLEQLGIIGTIRVVDSSQYQKRLDGFDFDMVVGSFPQSLSPGNEQRDFWGSAAADQEGSRNLIGIKNPAIDALIDKIIFAKDRASLVAACRALDRVLLWNHYLVPQFYAPNTRIARWNRFGLPDKMPDYGFTTDIWWWDAEKAAKISGK